MKYLFSILIILLFYGCQKDNEFYLNKKLMNCSVDYLNFTNNYLFPDLEITYPQGQSENKISFIYSDANIVKILGGFYLIPGNDVSHLIFSKDVYDSLIYNNNKVEVYTLPKTAYHALDKPDNPITYYFNSNHTLDKVVNRQGVEYNYLYSDNIVTETNSANYIGVKILRKFYFDKRNLLKVEKEIINDDGVIIAKTEILFEEYDNKRNPFKNKFYILGAFYRAFSENNYQKYTVNKYHLTDGNLVLYETFWYRMPIQYDKSGYPLFGDYY